MRKAAICAGLVQILAGGSPIVASGGQFCYRVVKISLCCGQGGFKCFSCGQFLDRVLSRLLL